MAALTEEQIGEWLEKLREMGRGDRFGMAMVALEMNAETCRNPACVICGAIRPFVEEMKRLKAEGAGGKELCGRV
jgi:hypothetical protein